jgi:hypothetical protein
MVLETPTEVVLNFEGGMKQECAVNLDHLQTAPAGGSVLSSPSCPIPRWTAARPRALTGCPLS